MYFMSSGKNSKRFLKVLLKDTSVFFTCEVSPLCADGSGKCELHCRVEGQELYRSTAQVVDGTPCDAMSNDVCADGICQVNQIASINPFGYTAIQAYNTSANNPPICFVLLP